MILQTTPRKLLLLYLFSAVGFVSLAVFGAVHFLSGNSSAGWFEFAAAAITLLNAVMLRISRNEARAASIILGVMIIVLAFLTVDGGVELTGVFWFFTFPVLAFYLKPARIAVWWNVLLWICVSGIIISGHAAFSVSLMRQLFASYVAVAFLVYFFASIVEESIQNARDASLKLKQAGEQLKDEAKEHQQLELNVDTQNKELQNAQRAMLNLLEDLQEEKSKDEAVLSSIGDGLVVVDAEGKATLVNDSFTRILGWTPQETIGKVFTDLVPMLDIDGTDVPKDRRSMTRVLREGAIARAEDISYRRKNLSTFPAAISVAPVIVGGKTVGAVEVFRDITREKAIERAKSEFVSVASHQLRTPMTAIRWVLERFMKKEQLTERGKEYLADIHTSVERLASLVDALLNVSRIESSGGLTVQPESLDAVDFVEGYLKEVRALAEKKNITLVFDEHPATLAVEADQIILRNIVQSLVSNALEYTPDGGRVTVSLTEKTDARYVFTVADSGIGIPLADQPTLFEKFHRADNAKLFKPDGSGLGLYIVREAVTVAGGEITFVSEEGKGTTFTVTLPSVMQPHAGEKTLIV